MGHSGDGQAGSSERIGQQERAGGPVAGDPALLRAVFDVVAAGLYVVDAQGYIQLANPGAQSLLGYPEDRMLGVRSHDLFHYIDATGKHRRAENCPLIHAARVGRSAASDSDVFVRSNGALLPVAWSSAPILDDGRPFGAVVVFYDITRRVAADLRHDVELAEARQASEAAAAEAARTAFLADTTSALISTLDVDEALARLARLLVPRFADWCVIDLLEEEGEVRRVTVAHTEPAMVPRLGIDAAIRFTIPDSGDAPLRRVLRGAPSVVLDDFAPEHWQGSEMERNQLGLFTRLGAADALIVGLRARQAVIGAVTLTRTQPHPFDADDRALAEDIALRAGIAIDNARLFTNTRSTAEALQRSLLPILPAGGDLELCASYIPAGHDAEVGGDWYDAYVLRDGSTAVVLGDVVGHDLEAATRMGDIRNHLRAASLTTTDPAEVMRLLDQAMDQFVPGATATAVFARVERSLDDEGAPELRFRWSNAGHPPPLLVLPDGTSRYLEAEPDPLLGVDPSLPRTRQSEPLPPGATVLLYSDGLVEDRGTGLEPGLSRLRRAASRLAPQGARQLCDHLVEELGREAADDIAFIIVSAPSEGLDGAAPEIHERPR
ncbi:SpoIIE family protein phosphatase [Acidiferrimicrobium sp. IK]|uniref:SpoIIE family protein phosphatase n=1 Tax=Acidiferrimicrobium sp. IK TaxID=2871700 RepID=UPI0021CB4CD0|nr:SpoIIE family protein phosphatase [Acidiferrimicrobium sp. IK]MCU4186835.1 SpoIIE family protein phosphatase [Acidiferrimicrobium sp. IK]